MTSAPSSSLPVMAGYSYPPAVRTPTSQQFCQRWHPGGWHSWRHVADGGFDRRRFHVAEIHEAIAKSFIAQVHYLGSFPAARMSFGLFTDDDALAVSGLEVDGLALIGVAVLSVPMRAQVLTNVFPDLAPYQQTLELGRFALTDSPANAESFMLSQVWQLERCDYCQRPTHGSALCERDAEVLFGQGPPCSLPAGAPVRLLDGW